MIPDASGIYTDQEPMRIYDPQLKAYRDTKGQVYDPDMEAWREVWPNELVIYDHGAELVEMDFINNKYYGKNSSGYVYRSGFSTRAAIDVSGYRRLCVIMYVPTEYWAGTIGLSDASLNRIINSGLSEEDRIVQSGPFAGFSHGTSTTSEVVIDLSDTSGMYYLYIVNGNGSDYDAYAQTSVTKNTDNLHFSGYNARYQANIYKVWLE